MSALPADPDPAGRAAPSPRHASVAWLLHGIGQTAGVLTLRDGRLTFVSDEGVVFDEPLGEHSAISFPWWYFGGGFRLTAGGRRHRVSLAKPNNAPAPGRAVFEMVGADLVSAGMSLGDAVEGRRSGRVWRSLLVR